MWKYTVGIGYSYSTCTCSMSMNMTLLIISARTIRKNKRQMKYLLSVLIPFLVSCEPFLVQVSLWCLWPVWQVSVCRCWAPQGYLSQWQLLSMVSCCALFAMNLELYWSKWAQNLEKTCAKREVALADKTRCAGNSAHFWSPHMSLEKCLVYQAGSIVLCGCVGLCNIWWEVGVSVAR